MTAIVKTFAPAQNAEALEHPLSVPTLSEQAIILLQQMDSESRKKILLAEFRSELEALIAQVSTDTAAQALLETEKAKNSLLADLENQNNLLMADKVEQWNSILQNLSKTELPVVIKTEDDLVAIVAEATYRVLSEHLNPTEHIRRIVRQVAESHSAYKGITICLSESDYNLVANLDKPEQITFAVSDEISDGGFCIELGRGRILFDLEERLSQLNEAFLMARKSAYGN